ncbi:SGNH/GDSL hydrolase family protein [Amnibacterium setariae]|uniref:SGNH/GDSL hydrolase family protein n=1 Tax=Amnibacterium setariae TaxID=2306585 RepID=A0A3A1U3E0_9MICO|nr:SGNH/GDSL hydrolase family protein [Amnibacterium setariae]RIX31061.1 SGNH/GDSL hydrolase family protein [Amnibacterium setariae]
MQQDRRARLSRRGGLLAVGAAVGLAGVSATAPAAIGRTAASVPSTRAIHLIGDSWAAGLFADPSHALGQVAAAALGMTITVDAISGTGYVATAGAEDYLQRAQEASGRHRLVIVQGGSNDVGEDLDAIAAAATGTWRTLARRFPAARLLALGPGPDPEPVDADQRAVDAALRRAVTAQGVPYVSMLDEDWIPAARASAVLGAITKHPTPAGQQYLGLRLAAAIRLIHPEVLTGV